RTRVGVSTIPQAGWGLFATEDVARGELVGEYVGEIITDGEVERRGAIYDKGGGDGYLNCIFDLNRGKCSFMVESVVTAVLNPDETHFISRYDILLPVYP
ncbi:hypothetical protein BC938DRAFT_482518, partial [Jimgerdemannia flammicorona]